MAAENEVEIRFRIEEEKAASAVAQGKSATPAESTPQALSQRERDESRKSHETREAHSKWERVEHRIEHKMRHIGARLIAAQLVEEGADILGIGNSFVTRLGEHAIEGFMMAGPTGAAIKSIGAIVHQLAEIVKGHSEEQKKARERLAQQDEEIKNFTIELHAEQNKRADELAEKNREEIEKFEGRVRDEVLNSVRYITVPYLGRG